MRCIVIISIRFLRGFINTAGYLCLGDFMARLRDPDKAIVYLNQVEEHIDKQDENT